MDWIFKFLLIIVLAPVAIALVAQVAMVLVIAILPWLIALAVITGLAAGVSAGFVLRRRLPLRNGGRLPPGGSFVGQDPIRRPRGVRGQGEDR